MMSERPVVLSPKASTGAPVACAKTRAKGGVVEVAVCHKDMGYRPPCNRRHQGLKMDWISWAWIDHHNAVMAKQVGVRAPIRHGGWVGCQNARDTLFKICRIADFWAGLGHRTFPWFQIRISVLL